ncbi:ABC transporter permease [Desertimonas flava]|uniref:ABC transporter permease n=1 Tax=Desertimonas flava TaxID=2064846 RepID=UPI000E34BDED|nr:ABC transporter permease subunit [Desertimonas flava]
MTALLDHRVLPSADAPPSGPAYPARPEGGRLAARARRDLPTVAVLTGLLTVWEVAVRIVDVGNDALPAPTAIVAGLWRDREIYPRAIRATLSEAVAGFAVASVAAMFIGATCVLVPAAERLIMRVSLAIFCLPLIAIAPVLDLVLSDNGPRVALASLSAFFPIVIATVAGLQSVPRLELELIHALGGGAVAEVRFVRRRAAARGLLAGMRIGVTAAVLGALIGELIGAERGLGVLMLVSQKGLMVDRTWGVAVVAAAIAGTLYGLVAAVERLVGPTFPSDRAGAGRTAPRSRRRRALEAVGVVTASFAVLIGGWWLFVRALGGSPILIKTPADVVRSVTTGPGATIRRETLLDATWVTAQHALVGMAAGLTIALALALTFVVTPVVRRPLLAIAVVFQTVPAVAFLPLFVLLFGRQLWCVAVFGVVCVLFPSLVTMLAGLENVSKPATDLMHALGGGRAATMRFVRLPAALPSLFAATRIAVPNAVTGALVAEWLATGTGLGRVMTTAGARLDYDSIWAAAVAVTALSAIGYSAVHSIERLTLTRFAGG